jgi:hypothetical protein
MEKKPRRHWFAYRLRTLLIAMFVASLPLAWVAYSLSWIRQRRDAHAIGAVEQSNVVTWRACPLAPSGLWLFGETACEYLDWFPGTSTSLDAAQRLFPESRVTNGDLGVRSGT